MEEPRKSTVKTENRVNSIIDETRDIAVKSETRKSIVQTLTLVETATSPLDTRE